jgi:mannitol-1-/sugar-/sorbitol-6-/2-deoxyglucose-6-phosphatase
MIKAVIFDFDGIIIDSEPFWMEAEIGVFKSVGVHLNHELCRQTTGLNTQDSIRYWYDIHKWTNKTLDQLHQEIMDAMHNLIVDRVELKEGFMDVLQMFIGKDLPVAVASASPFRLIAAALEKFNLTDYFRIINSGDNEEVGKPHPALYLGAARRLGIEPVHCLAFEDSFNGAISAKAARMKLVAVPDSKDFAGTRFDFADLKIASLTDFRKENFEQLNSLN